MKVALADVLWEAATKHLCNGEYSCIAVKNAYAQMTDTPYNSSWDIPCMTLIRALGCDPRRSQLPDCSEEQHLVMRQLWLLLAMHVAEDEGIEIEVTK
jgi:hypothetical protein